MYNIYINTTQQTKCGNVILSRSETNNYFNYKFCRKTNKVKKLTALTNPQVTKREFGVGTSETIRLLLQSIKNLSCGGVNLKKYNRTK